MRHAWDLAGHAANPDEVRANVRRIASEMGLGHALPDTAKDGGGKSLHLTGDTLVYSGGEVKALGDGRFGGYLIKFGSPDQPDFVGDYFTKDTDFGLDDGEGTTDVLYEHGMDPAFGKSRIGKGKLKVDDVGVWLEAQLDLRRSYEEAVADRYGKALTDLIAGKSLGLSSGVPGHLVDREPIGRASWIKVWRLGLDASLTPHPCEPRTLALPLKSLVAARAAKDAADAGLGYDDSPRDAAAAMAAISRLADALIGCVCSLMTDDETPKAERDARIKAEFADFTSDSLAVINALMDDDGDGDAAAPDVAKSLARKALGRALSGLALSDHAEAVLAAVEAVSDRIASVSDLRARQGRGLSAARRDQVKALSDRLAALHAGSAPPKDEAQAAAARLRLLKLKHTHPRPSR